MQSFKIRQMRNTRKKMQLVWEFLTFFPTSGCQDALQNNSSFSTVHLLGLPPQWCCSGATFAELFKEKKRLPQAAPKSHSSPRHPLSGQLTHPLPSLGIDLKEKAARGRRRGSSLCLGGFALHKGDFNS